MPLVIYADVLVVVNLYVDFFLLWCVKKALGLRARARRLVLGALAGALGGPCWPCPRGQPGWLSFLLGAATALGAAGAAFAPLAPRMFAKAALCLWLFSFLLAGFCLFAIRFFAPRSLAVVGSAVYFDLSLPLLFCLTCGAYGAFLGLSPGAAPGRGGGPELCHRRGAPGAAGGALRQGGHGQRPEGALLRAAGGGVPGGPAGGGGPRLAPRLGGRGRPRRRKSRACGWCPLPAWGAPGCCRPSGRSGWTAARTGKPLDCYVALYPGQLSAGEYDALFNPDLFPEEAGGGINRRKNGGSVMYSRMFWEMAGRARAPAGQAPPPVGRGGVPLHQRAGDAAPAPHERGGGGGVREHTPGEARGPGSPSSPTTCGWWCTSPRSLRAPGPGWRT